MDKSHINSLINNIHQELLSQLHLESVDPHDPVEIRHLPQPWRLLGRGNYAAVVFHPDYPEQVVKIYAPGRPGFDEELEVYKRLGSHPAYSECLYAQEGVLVLKRLHGVTLYDCMHHGIRIPPRVIRDIDAALDYARDRGLSPHDIHGRNVMMHKQRGLVVDVSDFLHQDDCHKWKHLKKAYYCLYLPVFYPLGIKVPYPLLDAVRKTYRRLIRWQRKNMARWR
jgi:hypothetical protein